MKTRSAAIAGVTMLAVLGGAVYWFSTTGGSAASSGNGEVEVTYPPSGTFITPGVTIRGTYSGDGQVYVWVRGVNYAIPVQTGEVGWAYSYEGGLTGERVLVFASKGADGWSSPGEALYNFGGDAIDIPTGAGPRATEQLPSALRGILRPLEDVSRGVVVQVNRGLRASAELLQGQFGSSDLDGNGVSDRAQGSFAPPSSGVMGGIPLVWVVFGVLVLVVLPTMVFMMRGREILAVWQQSSRSRAARRDAGAVAKVRRAEADAKDRARLAELKLREEAKLKAKAIQFQMEKLRAVKDLKAKQMDLIGRKGS